jgi:deazaflavin-dependent oxidoreductase (nitroreductase family)
MGKALFRFFTRVNVAIYKLTAGRLMGQLIIVRHKGARSGKVRESALRGFHDGNDYMVAASANGSPKNPGWYYNLMANPETVINDSGQEIAVVARDAGPRRDELWSKVIAEAPRFKGYEKKADRVIPIVLLSPL